MSGGFVVGNLSQTDPQTDPKIAILGVSGGPGGVPGGPGASRSVLGGSWGRLGESRGRLGASGDRLWGGPGAVLGGPGAVLGRLGGVLGRPGGVLGASWGLPGASSGVLGASWDRLGASRSRLGRHFLASFSELVFGAILEAIFLPFWTIFGAKLERKNHQKPWRVVQNQGFRGFVSDRIWGPFWELFWKHFRLPNRSQIDPRSGLGASWGLKTVPRRLQDGPRRSQDEPKTVPKRPKKSPRPPKRRPRRPKTGPRLGVRISCTSVRRRDGLSYLRILS